MTRKLRWLAVLAMMGTGMVRAAPADAQADPPYRQVISANPFGLLLEFFNAEYERVAGSSSTWGIGGSYGQWDVENDFGETESSEWLNADVFWRYYVSGDPFQGWNFGAKVGITSLDSGTYPGFGFDANRSWLLGGSDNFYVGLGFGLKRLIGDIPDSDVEIIPTFRIVNIGFAF